jgi:hypothetical protein
VSQVLLFIAPGVEIRKTIDAQNLVTVPEESFSNPRSDKSGYACDQYSHRRLSPI